MDKQKINVRRLLIPIFLINLIFSSEVINRGITILDSLEIVKEVNKIYE